MIDMAIKLSRRHREEQLKTPEFFELLGELIESQCNSAQPQQSVIGQPPEQTVSPPAPPGLLLPLPLEQQQPSFIQAFQYNPFFNQYLPFTAAAGPSPPAAPAGPPMALPCGLFTPPEQQQQQQQSLPPPSQYQYYYPIPQQAGALYPTPPQSEISTSPPLYPPTPETPDLMSMASDATGVSSSTLIGGGGVGLPPPLLEYYHHHHPPLPFHHHHIAEPGYLHRQLKRAVANGDAAEGLAMYLALEKAGKLVNVTESSSLIEQLVRADMTHEATQITQTMLLRNTHPLPKIFR
jgi:hypothetical protein